MDGTPQTLSDAALTPQKDSSVSPRFTDRLWESTADLRGEIDSLEFLQRLGDGTLALDDFYFYMHQDAIYLAGYSRALALLAAKAPDPHTAAFWAQSSHDAAVVEASLHEDILATNNAAEARVDKHTEASPTCLGYVSYLIATAATAPYAVGCAAVLPCFWLYADVSSRLAASAADVLARDPEHPFAQWVAAYDGEEFQSSVRRAREVVDGVYTRASEEETAAMFEAHRIATRYELLFWDTALNRQPWPRSTRTGAL
ncbi:TenA family protein [Lysinibacter sp. HNR]|uniref:TenA family protein n=1 Tax=Lysinibacter sp. HNR TaxID=3031408 RepID=UPI0024359E5C|nr:TenA family protein [Lysinibacter sp. HNR]WGD36453.1 TenA family protein [Lysinibacter sp. HNR]